MINALILHKGKTQIKHTGNGKQKNYTQDDCLVLLGYKHSQENQLSELDELEK